MSFLLRSSFLMFLTRDGRTEAFPGGFKGNKRTEMGDFLLRLY